jgi:hypothetical protein
MHQLVPTFAMAADEPELAVLREQDLLVFVHVPVTRPEARSTGHLFHG